MNLSVVSFGRKPLCSVSSYADRMLLQLDFLYYEEKDSWQLEN